jgi:ubiquinone/menaquinone biosynthesis C-methylase UbiE
MLLVQSRERAVLTSLKKHGLARLDNKRILDIGCGNGGWLRDFTKWGACPSLLHGVDLLPDRISYARRFCPPDVHLTCGNAAQLSYEDGHFDIALQATVFTSILDAGLQERVAAEMLRVVRSGGAILWYDFHVGNPRNPNVRAVKRRDIRRLFPNCSLDLQRVTLAPPIGRAVARWSIAAYWICETLPLLRTHYFGVIRKP